MNQPFTDELISAYLDGELTAEEQAAVEQALLDNADCRQLFEELRALRGSLQALPSHKLPADFSQRVIRRAERAMLREAEPISSAPVAENNTVGSHGKSPAGESVSQIGAKVAAVPEVEITAKPGQWHGAVWAFAALAAALLVALYLPKIEMNPVAKVRDMQRNEGSISLNERETKPADAMVRKLPDAKLPEVSGSAEKGEVSPLPGLPIEQTDRGNERRALAKKAEGDEGGSRDAAELAKSANGNVAKGALRDKGEGDKAEPSEGRRGFAGFEAQARQVPAPVPGGPAVRSPAPGGNAAPEGFAGGRANQRNADGVAKRLKDQDAAEEPAWFVVRLQTTREALESGAFDRTLSKNNIRFEGVATAAAPAKETEELRRESRRLSQQASAEGVDVVFVEATIEQIQATLSDLKADRSQFLGVTSQLLSDESERSLEADKMLREKRLAANDRRSGGAALGGEANLARNRAASELEGTVKPKALAKLDDVHKFTPSELQALKSVAKPGAPKAAFGGGGGLGGAGPAGGNGPPAPGAPPTLSPAPGAPPALPAAPRAEDKANLNGHLAKAREETPKSGLASRIAPPSFREYNGLEFRKSAQFSYNDGEAAKSKKAEAEFFSPSEGAAKRPAVDSLAERVAEKKSVEKEVAAKGNVADAKPAAAAGAAPAYAATGVPGATRGAALGEKGQLQRDQADATPERIRVLFVIRAVEQEASGKPE